MSKTGSEGYGNVGQKRTMSSSKTATGVDRILTSYKKNVQSRMNRAISATEENWTVCSRVRAAK